MLPDLIQCPFSSLNKVHGNHIMIFWSGIDFAFYYIYFWMTPLTIPVTYPQEPNDLNISYEIMFATNLLDDVADTLNQLN